VAAAGAGAAVRCNGSGAGNSIDPLKGMREVSSRINHSDRRAFRRRNIAQL
jgi:hypothetical protein